MDNWYDPAWSEVDSTPAPVDVFNGANPFENTPVWQGVLPALWGGDMWKMSSDPVDFAPIVGGIGKLAPTATGLSEAVQNIPSNIARAFRSGPTLPVELSSLPDVGTGASYFKGRIQIDPGTADALMTRPEALGSVLGHEGFHSWLDNLPVNSYTNVLRRVVEALGPENIKLLAAAMRNVGYEHRDIPEELAVRLLTERTSRNPYAVGGLTDYIGKQFLHPYK